MLHPRYYQRQSIDAFFDYTVKNWGKHPIIVLPTGSGKSLVQAHIVKRILDYKNTRILMITHQKELIKQNYLELTENFDNTLLDIGIYSAGLNCRDTQNRIIFAGIQSVYKKAWELGWFDVILVDECHLIKHGSEGMFRTFMDEMENINKNIVIAGLSATAYRMKEGILCEGEGKLFDDICHETTVKELIDPTHFKNLDNEQYLCNLISKNAVNKADLSQVHVRGGEYIPGEMEKAFQAGDLVCRAVKEIKDFTQDRKKILVFTAGIAHCEEVTEKMIDQGLSARFIHSQQKDDINQENIKDFKDGKFNYMINVNVLSVGFNEKSIDCIALLRATKSPGLYYQMCGRGLRMYPDKKDCLVLDFGRNIERHGPIDKIEIRKKKDGKSEVKTAPQKECPECGILLPLAVMVCPECGYEIEEKDKHEDEASDANVLSKWKKPKKIDIENIVYTRHEKRGKSDSLKVSYYYNMFDSYSSWICIEHEGFARKKAMQWLKNVTDIEINSVADALEHCDNFREPTQIIVDLNNKFPNITGYIFGEPKKTLEKTTEFDKFQEKIKDEIDNEELGRLLF